MHPTVHEKHIYITLGILFVIIVIFANFLSTRLGSESNVLASVKCDGFSLQNREQDRGTGSEADSKWYTMVYKTTYNTIELRHEPKRPVGMPISEQFERVNERNPESQWHIIVDSKLISEDEYKNIAACVKSHIDEINAWPKLSNVVPEASRLHIASITYDNHDASLPIPLRD